MSIARPPAYRASAERSRLANEAEILARVTGSVAATVTHERRLPTGELIVESVVTYDRREA
jgi:hypothetical protein